MNKTGSLESQLMDAFKEKEEKETATTAADAQKFADNRRPNRESSKTLGC
jgi:hypothetical protein